MSDGEMEGESKGGIELVVKKSWWRRKKRV